MDRGPAPRVAPWFLLSKPPNKRLPQSIRLDLKAMQLATVDPIFVDSSKGHTKDGAANGHQKILCLVPVRPLLPNRIGVVARTGPGRERIKLAREIVGA